MKGGRHVKKGQNKDYSLIHHVFIDGSHWIKCTVCKMKWFPWDTPEALSRETKVRRNHTGLGWREVMAKFTEESTNTVTVSEQVIGAKPFTEADVPDTGNVLGHVF